MIVRTTPANKPDGKMLGLLLDQMPPLHGRFGRPYKQPRCLLGDAAYGSLANRVYCAARNVIPVLGAPRQPHGSGLGRVRYVVERTLAWFGNYRRIKLCYERKEAHFQAFHELAAGLICALKLRNAG